MGARIIDKYDTKFVKAHSDRRSGLAFCLLHRTGIAFRRGSGSDPFPGLKKASRSALLARRTETQLAMLFGRLHFLTDAAQEINQRGDKSVPTANP